MGSLIYSVTSNSCLGNFIALTILLDRMKFRVITRILFLAFTLDTCSAKAIIDERGVIVSSLTGNPVQYPPAGAFQMRLFCRQETSGNNNPNAMNSCLLMSGEYRTCCEESNDGCFDSTNEEGTCEMMYDLAHIVMESQFEESGNVEEPFNV